MRLRGLEASPSNQFQKPYRENRMKDDPTQFETGSLVESLRDRIDPAVQPWQRPKPTPMSGAASVSLDPMTLEDADKLVTRLLAGFPNLRAHNPEGYFAA